VLWSITELARMSGVTSRTLRHYDDIGLLPPARIGSNGYRYYEQRQLLQLQEILLLRELGLGLTEIAGILDRQVDVVTALRAHHRWLLSEQRRLAVLEQTITRTILELQREGPNAMGMIDRPENLFEGFDASRYKEEARQRWPEQWQQSKTFTDTLTAADTENLQREMTAAMIRMAELMRTGASVEDPRVQDEVAAAYSSVCRFWTPDAQAFRSLGELYVNDERFRANYERIATGLAEFYRDAMASYADAQLS
jgi:MerR family transcriptional regulator, thiopeptide resistance regulator